MRKKILIAFLGGVQLVNAQVADSVSMGPGYANNIWYSLANDEQGTQAASNWDIALATSFLPNAALTTSIRFNDKVGKIFEIPDSDPSDFENADTVGLSTWTPLFNSDLDWVSGALNNTTSLGQMDYGWGNYNTVSHNIEANRIFVIKYNDGSVKKFIVNLLTTQAKYELISANYDNTNESTQEIDFSNYGSKNYIYYQFTSNTVIDREPASANWDLLFTQYGSSDYTPQYMVTGVLQNLDVEVAKVYPVNNPETYADWANQGFSNAISAIGYDWKTLNAQYTFDVADSTVYFIKDKSGDIWKVIFTGFVGSSAGKFKFTKELISELSVEDNESLFVSVYPNPVSSFLQVVIDVKEMGTIQLINALGQTVYNQNFEANGLNQNQIPVSQLEAGIYILQVKQGKKSVQERVIIQ